jgi:uncharacterized protein (DUF2141 family)
MSYNLMGRWFTFFMAIILASSCAKVSSPAGGPKDKEPPVVVKSEPVNGQTNFRDKKITVTFNEFVTLDKISEKFMVSPPMKKKPLITIRGKNVVIEYDEELKDSTTYTFYFQDAIRDLNESNPIDNFQFVISTGNVVDSLSVTGNVLSAFSLDPPENTLVMLYSNPSDTAVIKNLPDYITKSTKTGYFRIDNLKEGRYRLYALKDADNSKNFNLPDEEFAFLDTVVEVTSAKNYIPPVPDSLRAMPVDKKAADTIVLKGDYRLILFQPEKKMRYLTSSKRETQYKLIYTLSLPPDTIGFDFSIPDAASGSYFIENSREGDTIQVWLTDSSLYSQPMISSVVTYPFTDTLGNTVSKQDTILMRFLVPRPTRAKVKPELFRVISSLAGGSLKPGQNIIFTSQTPLRDPDTSRIRIYEVREKEKIKVPYKIERDRENSCRLIMTASIAQKKNYLLIADSAAFGNIYGEQTDSTGNAFTVKDVFSKLKLNISNFEGTRIIQLLDEQDKILREAKTEKDGATEFTLLDKGRYRIRVIYDINGDGEWTTGDFVTRRQPEPVSFYPREIDLPENFWADQDWDISEKNIKLVKSKPKAGSRTGSGR